jgi:hypothetical protein
MPKPLQWLGQAVVYAATIAVIGYLSAAPSYNAFPADQAMITLSFSHGAQRKGECHRRTAEEIAKLAPNMRRPMDCPRERWPVEVTMQLDDKPLLDATYPPTGLSSDGPAQVFVQFTVPTGRHRLVARLDDDGGHEGFEHSLDREIELAPRQRLVLDFRSDAGGFILR